jgi:hypothetical protein
MQRMDDLSSENSFIRRVDDAGNVKMFFDESDSDASYMVNHRTFDNRSFKNQTPASTKLMVTSDHNNDTPISNPNDNFMFKTASNLQKQMGKNNVILDTSSNNSSELKAMNSDRNSDVIPEDPSEILYQTNSPN